MSLKLKIDIYVLRAGGNTSDGKKKGAFIENFIKLIFFKCLGEVWLSLH